jgi:[protein-PII] uridylyltransferase
MTGASRAEGLRAILAAALGDPSLQGDPLRAALVTGVDGWLQEAFAEAVSATGAAPGSLALVAVGSYGRRDPSPRSDLDLVLLHAGSGRDELAAVADALWYPIWDAKVGLDHSVRTVEEAISVAGEDLKVALGLLDCRLVAGQPALAERLRATAHEQWRRHAARRMVELREAAADRATRLGELAFLLEPDLKEARGGIRDVLAIRAAAAAWLTDAPGAEVRSAYSWLLDVRGALHRVTGRSIDRLVLQEHGPVAGSLEMDVDALERRTSHAGRVIAYGLDETWRRVEAAGRPSRLGASGRSARLWSLRRTAGPRVEPLGDGVIEAGGEVSLQRHAAVTSDPVLPLRVAAAAAQRDLPIGPATLARLAEAPPLPDPWPRDALEAFVALLEAGRPAVRVFEAVDQAGLLVGWLPEWESVRFKQQHNPVHRFTVDRHLVETAANAASLARQVTRPDLLVLAALLHDIGKGAEGDHTDAGVRIAPRILHRMGLPVTDVNAVTALVQHHLLLPDTAARRDPDDPATVALVTAAVGDVERLDLLHALTEADALAAGPAAWTEWKAGLVAALVERARAALGGRPLAMPPVLDEGQRALATASGFGLAVDEGAAGARVTVAAPDAPGLLWRWAAVMALHRLQILSATAAEVSGRDGAASAVTIFEVRPGPGGLPDPAVLRQDLQRVLIESAGVEARLADRDRSRRLDAWSAMVAPPTVVWSDSASANATVVEVRAHDSAGLLARLARALADAGLSVRQARIQTLGAEVVDAFYVVAGAGGPLLADEALRDSISRALLAACERPMPAPT